MYLTDERFRSYYGDAEPGLTRFRARHHRRRRHRQNGPRTRARAGGLCAWRAALVGGLPNPPCPHPLLLPFSGSVRALKAAYTDFRLVPLTENTPQGVKLPAMSTIDRPYAKSTSCKDASVELGYRAHLRLRTQKYFAPRADRGEHRSRASERAFAVSNLAFKGVEVGADLARCSATTLSSRNRPSSIGAGRAPNCTPLMPFATLTTICRKDCSVTIKPG